MLYKLGSSNGNFDKLEPIPFKDFSNYGKLEKHLEDLLANSILDVLFEDSGLMPVFRERQYQAEADIYALNDKGELIIFELKRCSAGEGAIHQALRYAQDAGQWSFSKLQEKYKQYTGSDVGLIQAHKEAFNLEHALDAKDVNNRQHLFVVGSAADSGLINAIAYWKKQGVSIDFLPYRIYELGGEKYFEFFALPYDKHKNPGATKGVLFNTNRRYDEDSIWYMMENSRVAAFGDAKRFIEYVYPGDFIFFSHNGYGLVAAAKVKKGNIKVDDEDTLYRDVDFITPIPNKTQPIKAMPFGEVAAITGLSFFWARTIVVPYLSKEESENLANKLNIYLTR
jgi:hypothetical protein